MFSDTNCFNVPVGLQMLCRRKQTGVKMHFLMLENRLIE